MASMHWTGWCPWCSSSEISLYEKPCTCAFTAAQLMQVSNVPSHWNCRAAPVIAGRHQKYERTN
eukprot:2544689-Amphidinium_carterae.2